MGALIDMAAILPFYLSMIISMDLRFMRVFRLLRLLKLTRYSPALESFADVIKHERRPLAAALLIMTILWVFSSSIAYMFEKDAQPEAFASIPHAMWWSHGNWWPPTPYFQNWTRCASPIYPVYCV